MSGRILVVGGPRVGKTTFARNVAGLYGFPVRSTDALIDTHGWSEASAEVAVWLSEPGPWVVEGVAVARAIRKWLAANPEGLPADVLFVRDRPRVDLTPGQSSMAKGHATVWAEIEGELSARGLPITSF